MTTDDDRDPDGTMTLALSLRAARRLTDPAAAVADAREWSRHVGVVDDDADAVAAFVAEHGLTQDFEAGERDRWLAMQEIREETHTRRHVFVGAGPADRRVAEHTGWEFRHVREAAEKAGWELGSDDPGLLDGIREALAGRWPF